MGVVFQQKVAILAQAQTYPIVIGTALFAPENATQLQGALPEGLFTPNQRVLIVTDDHVARNYLAFIESWLSGRGCQVASAAVVAGETAKSWDNLQTLVTASAEHRLTRHDAVLALGGGVVSDLAGLVAALYYRGCRLVTLPTTLLAMVDASVGGKVAINSDAGKNTIGTFYQPSAVLMNLDWLTTLPIREYRAGLAEIVKTALLETTATGKSSLLSRLTSQANKLSSPQADIDPLADVIHRCVSIKQAVVERDPLETSGERLWLNLGHTFAHAYEKLLGYGSLLHGEAVAIGLIDATQLAIATNRLPNSAMDELLALFQLLQLEPNLPAHHGLTVDAVLDAMAGDKKHSATQQRFVLPIDSLGNVAVINNMPDETLRAVLAQRLFGITHHD